MKGISETCNSSAFLWIKCWLEMCQKMNPFLHWSILSLVSHALLPPPFLSSYIHPCTHISSLSLIPFHSSLFLHFHLFSLISFPLFSPCTSITELLFPFVVFCLSSFFSSIISLYFFSFSLLSLCLVYSLLSFLSHFSSLPPLRRISHVLIASYHFSLFPCSFYHF